MKSIIISKPDRSLTGILQLPASKSISNRLLIIGALSGTGSSFGNLSDAGDTVMLIKHLETIHAGNTRKKVIELDAGNAGTVIRFLTAYLSMKPGKWVLTGADRMKQRPIGVLVEALRELGASIEYLAKPGYPPLLITGTKLHGGEVTIDSGISSQFTTALLLIAPYMADGLVLHLKGRPISTPYAAMTLKVMQMFGVTVKQTRTNIRILPGTYVHRPFIVESDWSAAAFWYEAAVFAEDPDIELRGVFPQSLQGDAILPSLFQNFGIRTEFVGEGIRLTRIRKRIDGFYFDFTDYPDIAQAVIATCAGLGIRGRFEGLQSLRIKETDRLLAMKNEIGKLGVQITFTGKNELITAVEIKPGKPLFPEGITFETYGDHRTAMTIAMFVLKSGSLKIMNPDVVEKSYPTFWDDLQSVGFTIR
jgi:3-phosphoshikimate 1-carboxyvinyltransferase